MHVVEEEPCDRLLQYTTEAEEHAHQLWGLCKQPPFNTSTQGNLAVQRDILEEQHVEHTLLVNNCICKHIS